MPNGFYGTDEEWGRIESPLRRLDPILCEFAERHGMKLSRNYHNWPERTLAWGDDVQRKIQVFLESAGSLKYTIYVVAWQTNTEGHFVKQQNIAKSKSLAELEPHLADLLDSARSIVGAWSAGDLLRAEN